MIAAIKQAIAIYANDPEWARVRPPLVELTTGAGEIARRRIEIELIRDDRNEREQIRNSGTQESSAMGERRRTVAIGESLG